MQQVADFKELRRTVSRMSGLSQVELWGCAMVAALAVVPRILLEVLADTYSLPPSGEGDYPFVVFAVGIVAIIAVLRPLYLVLTRHPSPTRQLFRDIRENRGWLAMAGLMVVALPETLDAATRFKKIIPQLNPFYADLFLADIEQRLLGRDAWQITHALFGPEATRLIDLIYGLWHLVNISVLTWIVLSRNRAIKLQAALCYQLAWLVMGAGMAIAFSSVGPCFLEHFTGDVRFRPLMQQLNLAGGETGLHSLTAMKYLLATEGRNAVGGGISAMPSLHVAIATFVFMLTRILWPRRLAPTLFALGYYLAILLGSVHLGWHYLSDGIAGTLGMAAIWAVVRSTLSALTSYEERLEATKPASHQSPVTTAIETNPSTR
jgi:hypothetical protein